MNIYLGKAKHQLKTLLTNEILLRNQTSIKFCPGSFKYDTKLKLNMCEFPSCHEIPPKIT